VKLKHGTSKQLKNIKQIKVFFWISPFFLSDFPGNKLEKTKLCKHDIQKQKNQFWFSDCCAFPNGFPFLERNSAGKLFAMQANSELCGSCHCTHTRTGWVQWLAKNKAQTCALF